MGATKRPAVAAAIRVCALTLAALAVTLVAAGGAAALNAHGQVLRLAPGHANANQSGNWFGYNQGAVTKGTLFNSITGNWTVPKVSQHTKGQAEYSSDWIGIGGGCPESTCTVPDATLIQTGTEQDVSSSGAPSYSAWWEIIPLPSINFPMTVAPGDRMHASVAEPVPFSNVWTITLTDVTRGETDSQTVPYTSSHDTAEWIEETPLIIGTGAGFAPLPNATSPAFDLATVNGAPAKLAPSQEIQLVDSNGKVIGAPSAPDPDADGFNACTWATLCAAPTKS
jgi:hypothetical protein